MKNLRSGFIAIVSLFTFATSVSCNNDRDDPEDAVSEDSSIHQKLAFHEVSVSSLEEEREKAFIILQNDEKFVFFTSRDTLYGSYQANRDSLAIINPSLYKKIKFSDIHTKNDTPPQNDRDKMFADILELSDSYKYYFDEISKSYILKIYPKKGEIIIGNEEPMTLFGFGSKKL